jgi:hypothetical protein
MKKQYSSPCIKFTINLKVDGKSLTVVFPDWDRERKRKFIIVSDEKIQKQLEANEAFNTYFHLDTEYVDIENVPEVEQGAENVKPVVTDGETLEVENLAAAKKYLAGLGIKVYPSMNKAKAIEAAKEKKIQLIINN